MNKSTRQFIVEYKYLSTLPNIGSPVRKCRIDAESYGDAEKEFDRIFDYINIIADDIYGDDAVYQIISITEVRDGE